MFTVLAKGGAPSGHTCPKSTMAFKAKSMIKIRVFGFSMEISDNG